MPTPEQIWSDADLPARRLAGLALNPSAPESILLRLLADAPLAVRMVLCRDRILPDAVVDAVIEHPDAYTRSFFARNPHVDPAQRVRLLDDPEWFVRAHLAGGPRWAAPAQPRPLPDEAVVHMISTYEGELLGGYGFYQQISTTLRRSMPTHPVPKVRCWGVNQWASLSADTRAALLTDPDDEVRETARRHARRQDPAWVESALPDRPCHARNDMLLHHALSRAVVDGVLESPVGEEDKAMIAVNPSLPPDVVVLLAVDPDPEIRGLIAHRADLGPAERHALVADPNPDVRTRVAHRADLGAAERRALATDPAPQVRLAVSVHPALSEEERARIDYEAPMDHVFVFHRPPEVPQDPKTVRRKALSSHPLLRRQAARDHLLPPDLVARLAADDDLGVRVLLAQHHPDAPAPLLLRSFLEYTGPERSHLTTRPNFPTGGLAAFADHEDPEVRALAACDLETEPAAVERLTLDPDPAVRAAATRHPKLPQSRLAQLLDDEELAHAAAANPALSQETIRGLVMAEGQRARPPA
ncbi:hypothetical protein [Streptomyces resistomycificus]|uniref:Leucine rich repeat variant n=1 Tax=Streptomyces resistomycificus TaxID=67356 RepID=A0A0L8LG81_9ACTN|nr:hypothetical protein [Streptomyces resistomycificus]KOG37238.1 hypothetical protein ADK37_12690 [Streptomyces resistomycificus]KUN95197.1 hypothetical protein AQJ84_24410 [Streptomyces resistomycificus]